MKTTAIVLAGGSGSRMKSDVKKQYLLIDGKPVLWYSLEVFQQSAQIDEIVLVCGKGECEQCRQMFVEEFGFDKVAVIVEGGKERYHSVYEGLKASSGCDYVLIHDGARPFIEEEMIERILDVLPECRACTVGMPVKDTIKLRGENGCVEQTLPREKLWMIQTPQSFSYPLIRRAFDQMIETEQKQKLTVAVTDDAMVAERFGNVPVRLLEGSYENIKITTPEDLFLAEALVRKRKEKK